MSVDADLVYIIYLAQYDRVVLELNCVEILNSHLSYTVYSVVEHCYKTSVKVVKNTS